MTGLHTAAKLALEALEFDGFTPEDETHRAYTAEAITALRQALEQPAQQEPVAWNVIDPTGKIVATEVNAIRGWARIQGYKPTVEVLLAFHEQGWRVVPTIRPQAREGVAVCEYCENERPVIHAPAREWVGLTDEEVMEIAFNSDVPSLVIRTVEAKIKERNK